MLSFLLSCISLFLVVLGFHRCVGAFCNCSEQRLLFIVPCGLLIAVSSFYLWASVVVAHGPSCPKECEIFPEKGSYLCPLHWQVDS